MQDNESETLTTKASPPFSLLLKSKPLEEQFDLTTSFDYCTLFCCFSFSIGCLATLIKFVDILTYVYHR